MPHVCARYLIIIPECYIVDILHNLIIRKRKIKEKEDYAIAVFIFHVFIKTYGNKYVLNLIHDTIFPF